MLVYGDLASSESSDAVLRRLEAMLRDLAAMPPGIARHGHLVGAFIEAGALAQGVADEAFAQSGQDDLPSPALQAATALLTALSGAVGRSWHGAFHDPAPLPWAELRRLGEAALPAQLSRRLAEGFGFYAVYPEAFLQAAAPLAPAPDTRVIGLRSIGTPLSAMVATGLGAGPPVTLRPTGHPFARQLSLSAGAEAALLEGADRFAVVDEGPGLSGSSFGAVLDFLEDRGVAAERITVFPSHHGAPGPQASERHRARWPRLDRRVVGFETLLRDAPEPAHRLEHWAATLLGPPTAPLRDVSGGGWRALRFGSENDWPAVHPFAERRKLLFQAADGPWLLKFIGLGRHGEEQAERARELAAAGFSPPVAGFRHGFLLERWIEDAQPLHPDENREGLLDHLARYLAFRARSFGSGGSSHDSLPGATVRELWQMARHNAAEALGDSVASLLDPWQEVLPRLEARVRRLRTDNRLQCWEWLRLPDGGLLKTDAVDHAAAHDLVGCQDLSWDLAGAAAEMALTPDELHRLHRRVESLSGTPVDETLLALMRPCYLAFQLGSWSMAAQASDPASADHGRAAGMAALYGQQLAHLLRGEAASPHPSR
ncbi:hypothetical protein [Roseomonas elaeocarpi]|uniref:Uncharacterized protein n=1 Tax=Roseomonas elaeocarpi TaxID=907779 RepID=A0ABV6JZJ0_9PROT